MDGSRFFLSFIIQTRKRELCAGSFLAVSLVALSRGDTRELLKMYIISLRRLIWFAVPMLHRLWYRRNAKYLFWIRVCMLGARWSWVRLNIWERMLDYQSTHRYRFRPLIAKSDILFCDKFIHKRLCSRPILSNVVHVWPLRLW